MSTRGCGSKRIVGLAAATRRSPGLSLALMKSPSLVKVLLEAPELLRLLDGAVDTDDTDAVIQTLYEWPELFDVMRDHYPLYRTTCQTGTRELTRSWTPRHSSEIQTGRHL